MVVFPKLLRTHFAKTLVALDGVVLAAFVDHIGEQLAGRGLLHRDRFGLALGGLGAFLLSLLLVCALGIAELFLALGRRLSSPPRYSRAAACTARYACISTSSGEIGRRCQFPVDDVLGAMRVHEGAFPQTVLSSKRSVTDLISRSLAIPFQGLLHGDNLFGALLLSPSKSTRFDSDTVTVGDETGVVLCIHMRATTILMDAIL